MSSRPSNPVTSPWITRGFKAFRRGTFGNGGQNLYVSRAGVLQRIHQFDLDRDGHVDLVFCNSQDHGEKPPVGVYEDVLGRADCRFLPSDGGRTGVVADLNGDGYDDLVVGMFYNGIRRDLNAYLYYGGPDGYGEGRVQYLPAPCCTSVAAGDFNGDGKPDLAFVSDGRLRLFYQTALGFEPKGYRDLDAAADQVAADQVAAGDLDGDGCADLVVRDREGKVSVCWGGPDGIDPNRSLAIPVDGDPPDTRASDSADSEHGGSRGRRSRPRMPNTAAIPRTSILRIPRIPNTAAIPRTSIPRYRWYPSSGSTARPTFSSPVPMRPGWYRLMPAGNPARRRACPAETPSPSPRATSTAMDGPTWSWPAWTGTTDRSVRGCTTARRTGSATAAVPRSPAETPVTRWWATWTGTDDAKS